MTPIAQSPQGHRQSRESEIRFRLPPAGREEEQIHGLAVWIVRIGQPGEVQQDEGELKGAPTGRSTVELRREPLPEGARNGAVRHTEGVEHVGVRRQYGDAAFHAIGGVPR